MLLSRVRWRGHLNLAYSIQKFYPIALADKTWDNTGLLVDSSYEDQLQECSPIKVLLTIDLTQSVAEEAVKNNVKFIMAYHPFIFRGLKSITQQDPQQRSLIKLIKNQISVYSPHTAVDSANGGVNDFLVDVITKNLAIESSKPIEKDLNFPESGMGRFVTLKTPSKLKTLVGNVKSGLNLQHVQVAESTKEIKTIAICAGSGGSVFKNFEADLYFTGELSHHEALYFKESGSSVICCNHSNTERAFLEIIKMQLQEELNSEMGDQVIISETDRDPFETW
ncbi:NIF3 [Candida oxycetoniae]|uniref:NIF3 n=1 Tax=Candida oxycetoniae TaxID=497107 RepID=A0AAI9WYN5_9ASCO|nr:NIF3 [Candida oxycetoniae]KAI3405546.1 NIF3 [Candida oxycetoniae]